MMKDVEKVELLIWYIAISLAIITCLWFVKDWNWAVIWESKYALLDGLANSAVYSFLALFSALPFAILLALARQYAPKWPSRISMIVVDTLRTVPQMMILLWIFFVAPEITGIAFSTPIAGYIGLTLISIGYLSEVVRAGIRSVSSHQWETGYAVGLSWSQTCFYIILPQAFRNMLPAFVAVSVMVFKTTTLVYVIGVVDFFRAATLVNIREIEPQVVFVLVALVYFVICYSISTVIRRFDPKYTLVD